MQTQAMPLTLIDAVLPKRRIVHNVMLVVVFSVLIALSAQIAIPLPFTPVPITMQTLTVLLTGLLLGSAWGWRPWLHTWSKEWSACLFLPSGVPA